MLSEGACIFFRFENIIAFANNGTYRDSWSDYFDSNYDQRKWQREITYASGAQPYNGNAKGILSPYYAIGEGPAEAYYRPHHDDTYFLPYALAKIRIVKTVKALPDAAVTFAQAATVVAVGYVALKILSQPIPCNIAL